MRDQPYERDPSRSVTGLPMRYIGVPLQGAIDAGTTRRNGDEDMTVTEQINNFVRLNGGNERDALNVALARLDVAEAESINAIKQIEIDIALMQESAVIIDELRADLARYQDERVALLERIDALAAELRATNVGTVGCAFGSGMGTATK